MRQVSRKNWGPLSVKRVFVGPKKKLNSLENAFATFSSVVGPMARNQHSLEKRSTITRVYEFPFRDLGTGRRRPKATLSSGARAGKSLNGLVRFRSTIRSRAQHGSFRTVL